MVDLSDDPPQELTGHHGVIRCPGLERLGNCSDRGQRRAQLVRDVGDKLPSHVFEVSQFRHVSEHHKSEPLPTT